MFREPEGEIIFEKDNLSAAPNDADKAKMNTQKGSGAKYNYGLLSSSNIPIPEAAPKPLSSKTDSRSIFPTKINSFAYSNAYIPM